MAPMVHGLEAEYFGRIKFNYLDADDPNTLPFQQTLGFVYQPEFYLLDGNGNVIQKLVGYVSQNQFRSLFNQTLK